MFGDWTIGKVKGAVNAGKSKIKRKIMKIFLPIAIFAVTVVILLIPIVAFIDVAEKMLEHGQYLISLLSGEPLYDEDALYEWQNGGDDDHTDSILTAIKLANEGDEEAIEIAKPIIDDSHLYMSPDHILSVFQECSDYNKRMFEVFNVDYSYRKWAWDNWGSETTGDRYYIRLTEPNDLNATRTGFYGTHGRSKYYPDDWINPSGEELGSDSEGCLSGWYWLMNPEQSNEDADGYPVYDISSYDGQFHEPDPWYGQEWRMDIEGEAEKDDSGEYIDNTHRFSVKWQDVAAMGQLVGLYNYHGWSAGDKHNFSLALSFKDEHFEDYYITDEILETIVGLFEYKFDYLYEPDTADHFVERVYEAATIEFNFLKAEKGDYEFAYHFLKEEPESVLDSAWSGGQEHYEWVTAYVPESAPSKIANSYETLEYIYTSTDNVPNYVPEGDTYTPPKGHYCVGRFDIQDPSPFIETVSTLLEKAFYEKTDSTEEVASGYGDEMDDPEYVERMDYHWAISMIEFYTYFLDFFPYAEGQSDIYTELAKDYDENVIRISYEGTQTQEYSDELLKLLAYYENYTVVFPLAEGMEDDGLYPEGWTTDITHAKMGTEEFYEVPTDLSGIPFHSYGVTYHGEDDTTPDTEEPKPINNEDEGLTEEQNVMYETLLELLVANGYAYIKAKGMAYAFSILYPKYGLTVACGVLANIAHEGSPGKMEYYDGDGYYTGKDGKQHKRDWFGTTKTQQSIAGKNLTTSAQLLIAETIPSGTAAGLGMCQWSFGRRVNLLKEYKARGLFDAGTFDSTDCMIAEVSYMISELEGGYSSVVTHMSSDSSAYEAAMTFQKEYEKPANISTARGNTGTSLYKLIDAWMKEGYSDSGT